MRFDDLQSVQRLIESRIPESASLEFKSDAPLGSDSAKRELLKDLTGMGNGGGGILIFGLSEESETSIAREFTPLTDASFVGRVEDIVRDGIHPPLIWCQTTFVINGGFVVVVDVEQSSLGPYRVDSYNEGRYYVRVQRSTVQMSEPQVRDAYALASRAIDQRDALWQRHYLPLKVVGIDPWLVISALPFEPLRELFSGREVDLSEFRNPQVLSTYASPTGLRLATADARHWADGIIGEEIADSGPNTVIRLHRNGAVGVAARQSGYINLGIMGRELNAYLIYLAWFWRRFGLQRPVETVIGFVGLKLTSTSPPHPGWSQASVVQPVGLEVDNISITEELLPWELSRAHVRHVFIRRFIDRLTLAYGSPFSNQLFEFGWLYDRNGHRTNFALDRGSIWDPTRGQGIGVANLDAKGRILGSSGGSRAYAMEGVIIDANGDTVAVTEFATSSSCPDDFLPPASQLSDGSPRLLNTSTTTSSLTTTLPGPTRQWSNQVLSAVLE